jgi:hypothetical protein
MALYTHTTVQSFGNWASPRWSVHHLLPFSSKEWYKGAFSGLGSPKDLDRDTPITEALHYGYSPEYSYAGHHKTVSISMSKGDHPFLPWITITNQPTLSGSA